MAEQTGIYALLDDLGGAAEDLARIYRALVEAGIIRADLPEVTPPYVPPEPTPWYKSGYMAVAIAVGAVGAAGTYYAFKQVKK